MTVKELIEILQECPPEMDVVIPTVEDSWDFNVWQSAEITLAKPYKRDNDRYDRAKSSDQNTVMVLALYP